MRTLFNNEVIHRGDEYTMAKYIDGFVLVVPKNKTDDYKKMAEMGRDSWMKHGALAYFECQGDELAELEMGGERTRSFVEMAGAKASETVWFSFIVFKSKAHRNEVNAKVHAEMETQGAEYEQFGMPFDMKRMAYGGFQAMVEADSAN